MPLSGFLVWNSISSSIFFSRWHEVKLLKKNEYLVFIKGRINWQAFYAIRLFFPFYLFSPLPFPFLSSSLLVSSLPFSKAGVDEGWLLTKVSHPLARSKRTKPYTWSNLGQEVFIQCLPSRMSHSEALTRLRLSWVIYKSVLIIVSSSHLGMRKWFITPICWIIHSSGAKMAWNMSSEDVEAFIMMGIAFWYQR